MRYVKLLLVASCAVHGASADDRSNLEAKARAYADEFAATHVEWMTNAIPDSAAADFLLANVPLLECPDRQIEATYYYRWWTFRKHLFKSLGGWCVSEFMDTRAISCPVGHHIREGRWLRDKSIIDDYTRYWFKKGARPIHGPGSYVNWIVRAMLWREEVTGDTALADGLLDDLVANYEAWEKGWEARPWPAEGMYGMGLRADGLFHDVDDREGTELTLSGNGARVHVNAIMYGEAKGIAKIAARCGRKDLAAVFEARAEKLEKLVKERLWNEKLGFFTPRRDDGALSDVCELHGYTPWLAGLPLDEPKYAAAWRYLTDEKGFRAKVGLTFPVQSAPGFRISYEGHGCQWNGPSWPFATSVALTALGDALHAGLKLPVGKADWFDAFRRYSLQNRQKLADGRTVPWIDEVQDPYTGDWIAYRRWTSKNYAYNHSTFCDLVISGLVGLKVAADGRVTADPFIPDDWGWFRLANVPVRGRLVTVTFDRDGTHYGQGEGLRIAVCADADFVGEEIRAERESPVAFRRASPVWFADAAALAKAKTVSVGRWIALDEQQTFVRVASDRPVRVHFSWKFVAWIPGDGKAHDFPILNGKGSHEFKLEIPADATYVCAEAYRQDGTVIACTAERREPGVQAILSMFSKTVSDPDKPGKEKCVTVPLVAAKARSFELADGLACQPSLVAFAPPNGRHWLYQLEEGKSMLFKSAAKVNGIPTASIRCNEPGTLVVKWGDEPTEQARIVCEKHGGAGFTVVDPLEFDRIEFLVEKGQFEVNGVGATTLTDLDLALSSLTTSDAKLNAAFTAAKKENDRVKAFGLIRKALGITRLDRQNKILAFDPTVKNGLTYCGAKICVGVDEDEVIDFRWMREGTEGMATDSGKLPEGWKVVRNFDMQAECQRLIDTAVADKLSPGVQFCAYKDGKCIVNVFAGKLTKTPDSPSVKSDSLFPIFSTEKPLLSTACHRAVERGLMDYDKPLCTWWPELKGDGKEKLTLRETLGYRTCMPGGSPGGKGNPVCDHPMSDKELCDWDRVCRAAAADKPYGVPGTTQAYLPYAYAWMIGHPLEVAMKKPLREVLDEEVLIPSGIEREFYFVVPRKEYPRVAEYYDGGFCEMMNEDWARQALMPSAWAVSSAEALCKFYNRLCGYDGKPPLIRKETLDAALKPCRHPSDPLPNAKSMKRDWFMLFGMGYGLWGSAERMDRVFGHGGAGGSEALVDRDNRLIVGFTCNSCKNSIVLRDKLYEVVGMRWRYWNDNVNIQDLQMKTSAGGDFGAGITSH